WVPGHVDFEPNERVDAEAKSAAENTDLDSPRHHVPRLFHSPLPRSAAASKAEFRTRTTSLWSAAWKASPRFEKFCRLD
ncbi:hypothetical protein C8R43DRAFT_831106, partial [Mycena crocata]